MQNYFTLLGVKEGFALNEADLHRAYVQLQQETHPDRMVGKSDEERAVAIQKSMDANEGYEALRNPLTRAQHMLALKGIVVNAESRDAVRPSQALLMQTMELREQLAEANDGHTLKVMVEDLKKAAEDCREILQAHFAANDLDGAAQEAIRLRYLGKSMEEAQMRIYQLKVAS